MANLSWIDRKNSRRVRVHGKHTLILTCLGIFEVPRMQRLQKAGIAVLYYFLDSKGLEWNFEDDKRSRAIEIIRLQSTTLACRFPLKLTR